MREGMNWQRLLWEFVVIVLGVLVALAVDQARGERSDRALEQEYLERLESDIALGRISLDTMRLQLAGAARNAEFLEPYLSGRTGIPADTPTVVAALYRASRSLANTDALPRTAFSELQSTGRIGLIRSVPTRAAVQEYYTAVDRAGLNLDLLPRDYRDFIRSRMPPSLQSTIRSECSVFETPDAASLDCDLALGDFDPGLLLRDVVEDAKVSGDLNLSLQQLTIAVAVLDGLLARTDSVLQLLAEGHR
jgi:hypothetical protein